MRALGRKLQSGRHIIRNEEFRNTGLYSKILLGTLRLENHFPASTEDISWDRGEMRVINLSEALKVALLVACYSTLGQTGAIETGALECSKLGFTGLGLCSDCDSLATFVKDADLERDCRACCVSGDDDVATYSLAATATLEVCPRRIMYYPGVRRHTGWDWRYAHWVVVNLF